MLYFLLMVVAVSRSNKTSDCERRGAVKKDTRQEPREVAATGDQEVTQVMSE